MERNRRKNKSLKILLISLTLLTGCSRTSESTNKSSEVNSVFTEILPQAFDSLTTHFNLKDKRILHDDRNTYKLKKTIIELTVDSLENDTTPQANLIRSLNKIIHQPVNLHFDSETIDGYQLIYEKEEIEKLVEINDTDICILNLSPIAFDEQQIVGCFYLALHCEEKKGRGYFIYIYKEDNNWVIMAILQTWHV